MLYGLVSLESSSPGTDRVCSQHIDFRGAGPHKIVGILERLEISRKYAREMTLAINVGVDSRKDWPGDTLIPDMLDWIEPHFEQLDDTKDCDMGGALWETLYMYGDLDREPALRHLCQAYALSKVFGRLRTMNIVMRASMYDGTKGIWDVTLYYVTQAVNVRVLEIFGSKMYPRGPQYLFDCDRIARILNAMPLLEEVTLLAGFIRESWALDLGRNSDPGRSDYRSAIQQSITSLQHLRHLKVAGSPFVNSSFASMHWSSSLTSLSLEHGWHLDMEQLGELLTWHANTLTTLDLRPGILLKSGTEAMSSPVRSWQSSKQIRLPKLKNLSIYDRTCTDFTSTLLTLIDDSPLESLLIEDLDYQTLSRADRRVLPAASIISTDDLLLFAQKHGETLKRLMPLALDRQEQLEYELALDPVCIEHGIELCIKIMDARGRADNELDLPHWPYA